MTGLKLGVAMIGGPILLGLFWLTLLAGVVKACGTPYDEYSETGVKGCVVYGEGIASTWSGPGVARNDCVWPWTDCTPIRITSLEPDSYGRSIVVVPVMYCDCYLGGPGPNGEDPRIVDLDPATRRALGLRLSEGLWDVRVERMGFMLPDTAL